MTHHQQNPPAAAAAPATADRTTLIAFALFVFLGGAASVAIRFTLRELPTFYAAMLRFASAAVIFWLIVAVRRLALPRGRALLGAILFGVLSVGASFIFISYGLTGTPASLYQIVMAIVPLLTLFLAALAGQEKLQARGLIGALLSIAGITLAFSGSRGANLSLPHLLAIVGGALCLAGAGVVAKGFPRNNPFITNAVAMTTGVPMLGLASLVTGERWVLPSQPVTRIALVYLVLGATVLSYLLYLFVLGRWTASATSYAFVLFPFVAIILASQLAGETITWLLLAGGVLVIIGVWIGALYRPHKAVENASLPRREPQGAAGDQSAA